MKCAICNGELDEEQPNAHLGKHGTESNYIMTYILALQKADQNYTLTTMLPKSVVE